MEKRDALLDIVAGNAQSEDPLNEAMSASRLIEPSDSDLLVTQMEALGVNDVISDMFKKWNVFM